MRKIITPEPDTTRVGDEVTAIRRNKTIMETQEVEGCHRRIMVGVVRRRDRPQDEAAMINEEWARRAEGMGHQRGLPEEGDPAHKATLAAPTKEVSAIALFSWACC